MRDCFEVIIPAFMALTRGAKFGPYEILSMLGAGGMGEVYRARDTALGRDVAIKILHPGSLNDADLLHRFRQEAQAAASLSHPNILAIYQVGEHEGTPYIVSELLEGRSLREWLLAGKIPLRKTMECAMQIADGLAAAHERGIVHRDLKPENIFFTRGGHAKILDFGLAKFTRPKPLSVESNAFTLTLGSAPGLVLGTVGYMSPEQVRAMPVDSRSDVFSFGLILYEMLSGKNVFFRSTAADTMSAILKEDPPELHSSDNGVSPALDRIVRRCMEKEPADRFQSVRDLSFALQAVTTSATTTLPASQEKPLPYENRGRSLRTIALVATGCLLMGSAVTWFALRAAHPGHGGTLTITEVSRLTHESGFSDRPTWSPDGAMLAFSSNRSGNFEIYVRRIEGGQEVNITNDPAQDIQPAFSPDGSSIAFVSTRSSRTGMIRIAPNIGFEPVTYGGDVWVVPALGGPARRLVQDANFPVWSPDGKKVAYVSGIDDHRSILEIPAEGGPVRSVLSGAGSKWQIIRVRYSPQGGWFIFETWDQRLLLMPTSGGSPREILRGTSPAWDSSGKLLYYEKPELLGGTRLESVKFDEASGGISGPPQSLGVMTGILRDLAVSRGGQQFVVTERQESLNLTRLPLAVGDGTPGGAEEELHHGDVRDRYPSFSPDGQQIAFVDTRLGDQEIWILNLGTGRRERLRLPRPELGANFAFWSRDGRRIAVTVFEADEKTSIWLASVDGSASEEVVAAKPTLRGGPFSPDGRSLVYTYRKDGSFQVFTIDLANGQERQLTFSKADKYDPIWSPDGKWAVYSSNQGGPCCQIWKTPAAGGEEQRLTSGYDRIRHLSFSPDGYWLYLQPNHLNVYRMPFSGGPRQQVTRFPEAGLFLEEPTLSPDGKWLVYCRNNGGSSLWLLELGSSHQATQ